MPHVIIKMVAGRSEEQKACLADSVTKAIMAGAGCDEPAVSVSIQDIQPDRWTPDVYQPDIADRWDTLYKKPGYGPQSGAESESDQSA